MVQPLHIDEIPLDATSVRRMVDRAMPEFRDVPIRRLASTGSTNVLFRLGDDLLVRLPRQPGGSASISKEARWLPSLAPSLPVSTPEVVAVFEPDDCYPERWSVVRWIDGDHPDVVDPDSPIDPRREHLAVELARVVNALTQSDVPTEALNDPGLRWYRGDPLGTVNELTRHNIERCRQLGDFELDLGAATQLWNEAMRLPGVHERTRPRWHHADLAAENLLVRSGHLTSVLDFGSLSVGDPTVDLAVAWEVLDAPARETFRHETGVNDETWLRGRAWALCITLMIWYYWTTMPARRASRVAIGRNILADAGYTV